MKVVIDISEKDYILVNKKDYSSIYIDSHVAKAIANGTPLPKTHGRLIDASIAYDKIAEQEGGNYVDMDLVGLGLEETPTIIESESEVEE